MSEMERPPWEVSWGAPQVGIDYDHTFYGVSKKHYVTLYLTKDLGCQVTILDRDRNLVETLSPTVFGANSAQAFVEYYLSKNYYQEESEQWRVTHNEGRR